MIKYLLPFLIIFFGFCASAQEFADKEFYLIDSLKLDELIESDRQLVDSCLKNYHAAKDDTTRIKILGSLIEPMQNDNWINYQYFQKSLIEKALEKLPNKKEEYCLKKSLASSLNNIGFYLNYIGDTTTCLQYINQSLKIAEEIEDKVASASANNNLGAYYQSRGNLSLGLEYFVESAKILEEIDIDKVDKNGLVASLLNVGYIYGLQGDVANALEYMHKSLKYAEEFGIDHFLAAIYSNIGSIYKNQGDLERALDYFKGGLETLKGQDNKKELSNVYKQIGSIYELKGEHAQALEYYQKGLEIAENSLHKENQAISLYKIGGIYKKQGTTERALVYYQKSLEISQEIAYKQGITVNLTHLGEIALSSGNLNDAEKQLTKALELAKEIGNPEYISSSSASLSRLSKKQGNFKEALGMYELHIQMRDSLKNEESLKATAQQQAKYEYEKQQAIKDAEHEKQLALEHKEQEKQQLMTYAAGGGLLLVLAFLGFVFNRLKVTRKQKNEIDQQKQEIEQTHHQLAEHHQEIQDSINYAKRIQEAIMPSYDAMHEALQNEFVLYEPKDVVAGDFFWMEQIGETVYYAAADCTGHGVPGAMVSVVCSNALTKSLLEEGIKDTGKLLDRTRDLVITQLAKSGEEVKDGMDISLCALNTKTKELKWAGANNPLWILRKGAAEFEETKADKQPIGKYADPKPFTEHTIQLNEGDTIYTFTDGYQDQFGGPNGKKFKAKQLKEIIINNQNKSLAEQKELLLIKFRDWQADQEQVDDVCIIGVSV